MTCGSGRTLSGLFYMRLRRVMELSTKVIILSITPDRTNKRVISDGLSRHGVKLNL